MMKTQYTIICIALLATIFHGCQSDKGSTITADQVAPVETTLIRYDQLVGQPETRSATLDQYPRLSVILFKHIVGADDSDSTQFRADINAFLDAEVTSNIRQLIDSVYALEQTVESDWSKSMALYHHYFPERSIPNLYTIQSNLAIANFVFQDVNNEDAVAASLDFFLGGAYPYIGLAQENPAFSAYNNRTFNPDHLVSKSTAAALDDLIPVAAEMNFLHLMIREGKKLFLLEKLSPHLPDTVVFEYTADQLAWCRDNEFEIWNFFLESDLIYETSLPTIRKYLEPAPTSQGMPPESPGRTGAFIGYKIIQSYLNRRPGTDYKFLVDEMDAQKILNEAKYKPRLK